MQQRKAILATVIGDDQQVGFRAMIMKQAIEYNLAGSAKNEANGTVHFTLQGNSDGLDEALVAIRAGTKKSSQSCEDGCCEINRRPRALRRLRHRDHSALSG